MQLEFDEAKNTRNIRDRGISLDRFAEMDPATTVVSVDARLDYGERRLRLFGHERTRVISLRRANRREQQKYAKATLTT